MLHKLFLPLNFFLIRFVGCYRDFYIIVRLFREPCHDIWLSHFDVSFLCLQPSTQNWYIVGFSDKKVFVEIMYSKTLDTFLSILSSVFQGATKVCVRIGLFNRGLQYDCQQEKVSFCNVRTKRKAMFIKICPACSIILGCLHILMSSSKISLP